MYANEIVGGWHRQHSMYGDWGKTRRRADFETVVVSAVDAVVEFVDWRVAAESAAVVVVGAWVSGVAWRDEITGMKETKNEAILSAMQDDEMQNVKVEGAVETVHRYDIHNIRCS